MFWVVFFLMLIVDLKGREREEEARVGEGGGLNHPASFLSFTTAGFFFFFPRLDDGFDRLVM